MSVPVIHVVLSDTVPRLLRRLIAPVARLWERRVVTGQLSRMSDRELADIGLSRAGIHAVFDPKVVQVPDSSRPVLDAEEERVLADLGLSRRFPFPAAGD